MSAALVFGFAPTLAADSLTWPLQDEIDLSDGFGDFRDGHFHGGIDLRTGGKVGSSVFAPVSGYIWRIKMSYRGYGKGLYLMGDDGFIYVFGHLSFLSKPIDALVKQTQVDARRYYLDIKPEPNLLPIQQGDFLGYSGQTGAGGPHLHFEKRSGDGNTPINPLTNGFVLQDRIAPAFERVGFQQTDDHSLFDNARRKVFYSVVAESSADYGLNTLPHFDAPFGILIDAYDQMRVGGMRQAVPWFELYIDGVLKYSSRFDSLAFKTTAAVRWEYDYVEAVDGRDRTRRLFKWVGNDFPGSRAITRTGGMIGAAGDLSYGRHEVRIVAHDSYDNQSELEFAFLWTPPGGLFDLDSVVAVDDDGKDFYFSRSPGCEDLPVDSVQVLLNRGNQWGPASGTRLFSLENGGIRCRAVGSGLPSAVLRLYVNAADGAVIPDLIFNGLQDRVSDRCAVFHEVVDEGLLVKVVANVRKGARCKIGLYSRGILLGVEFPEYFSMKEHVCFVPPRPEYAHIDHIGVTMSVSPEREFGGTKSDSMAIYQVGRETRQTVVVDEYLQLSFSRDNFYEPRFIEVTSNQPEAQFKMGLNSHHYQIFPEVFVCRSNFKLSLRVTNRASNDWVSGLCWLDVESDKWVWISGPATDSDVLTASSMGGGSFAAVYDLKPPTISRLTVASGGNYVDPFQKIAFLLDDDVSGIEDDRSIVVKLDGQWLIPEYNPGTKRFTTRPLEAMAVGEHHLGIEVTDRAGMKAEKYLRFRIKANKRN